MRRALKLALAPWWMRRTITPSAPPPLVGGPLVGAVVPARERAGAVAAEPLVATVGFDARAWSERLKGSLVEEGPPDLEIHHAVRWSPPDGCLYDAGGPRIDASARPFGPPAERTYPDSRTTLDGEPAARSIGGSFLWAGPLMTHFGHFLLEGIARLWAVERFPDLPVLVTPEDPLAVPSFRTAFLRAAGIHRDRLVAVTEHCTFEEVVVPWPSLVHDGGGHRVHRDLPLRVATALDGDAPPASERPVYLTRSRLEPARRRAEVEAALERELRAAGFLVVAPERLSLRGQIRLWRRHTTFVGQIGSAFHAALLAPPGRRTVVLAHEDGVPPHYPTIDELCGTDATYVACLRTDPASPKQRTHRDVILDVEAALEVIRSRGIA